MANESNKEWKERIAEKYGDKSRLLACRHCKSTGKHRDDCFLVTHPHGRAAERKETK